MAFATDLIANVHRALLGLRLHEQRRHWPIAEPTELPVEKRVILSGFFGEALGIGTAADLTRQALQNAHIPFRTQNLRPLHRALLTRPAMSFVDAEWANIWLIHANPPETEIALYKLDPVAWRRLYRIGYWAWETDLAPADWLKTARWFHEIWVPSTFVLEAFRHALDMAGMTGEAKKLRVVPHPVPPATMSPKASNAKLTALTLFDPRSDFDRKNPHGALSAWLQAFPVAVDHARFIIKTHASARGHPRYLALQRKVANRQDIVLMAETMSSTETLKLIGNSDILLSLHRGEGFGLPLAEAMARGVCVIATGWSGNLQFMRPDNSILIPYRLVPAAKPYNGPRAQWAEPDVAAAAALLRELVDDPARRVALGVKARQDMQGAFDAWTSGLC